MARFEKMHGLGNDFVVIDARIDPVVVTPQRARSIADRHLGIGCDQLIVIEPSATADAAMRIWNADGSEVESCGNAARAVGVLIGDATLETRGGTIAVRADGKGVRVDMGLPRFDWEAVPLAYPVDCASLPVAWDTLADGFAVNVGNPHVVFFVNAVDTVDLATLGPQVEHDALFPERINVHVAEVLAPDSLKMRSWERGSGLTQACGTGACAVAVAAVTRRLVEAPVHVTLPGGMLTIEWHLGESIKMTGSAAHVFTGEIDWGRFPA